jgi:hypothetical protein
MHIGWLPSMMDYLGRQVHVSEGPRVTETGCCMGDLVEDGKDAVIGEIVKATADNPDIKATAGNLGKAALTVSKTINNALLPLAAVNYAFDKARKYFEERFQKELSEKTDEIPEEQLVEPKASIAGPTLQGLAFAHEEPNLKDMYLSLLATSMDGRNSDNAHPAFVEIIKQLDSEEARLLKTMLQFRGYLPIIEIRVSQRGQTSWNVLETHLMNLINENTKEPEINPKVSSMVTNWQRLGLVAVDYTQHLVDDKNYEWVEKRPEYQKFKEERENDEHNVSYAKGTIIRTPLGIQFGRAVGLIP